MEIFGYFAAVLIGVSLGLIGGGGSVLTVPVLVYLMGVEPVIATTSSLFIVGFTSLVGGAKAYAKKQIDFRAVTEFGIPSILSIFIARRDILPAIPDVLFNAGGIEITKNIFLMLLFSVLMLFASVSMIKDKRKDLEKEADEKSKESFPTALLGLFVGLITGLLGAGGGFMIIPALVIFLKIPMKTAVGTSLLIIAINSLFGFLFSMKQFSYNWSLLLIFTVLGIAGIFVGARLAEKIPGHHLKRGFGWFILVMGIYIIVKELFLK